jgi:predicted nucleic acid-binding Zn ribbon protein
LKSDRNHCYICGIELSEDNAYSRKDTANKLHALCKYHYIEQQKIRNRQYVKPKKPIFLVISICGKKRKIFFKTKEEKENYIRERKTIQKFSNHPIMTSSCVGCTEDFGTGADLCCDECGSLLRYNNMGELQCENCDLVSTEILLPSITDREFYYDKKMLYDKRTVSQQDWFWLDQMAGSAFDVFYQKAYSKKLKQ